MLHIPTDAPFNKEQRTWINGFIAGIQSQRLFSTSKSSSDIEKSTNIINILYGTQTGNSEELANDAASIASSRGYEAQISELDSIDMSELSKMENAVLVVSTYGEGEMPDNAGIFWDALSSDIAPRLDQLKYGVLALGDTSYDEFCQAGKLIDTRLEQLGAVRMAPRIDCDVDYDELAADWLDKTIIPLSKKNDIVQPTGLATGESKTKQNKKTEWNKKNPFFAKVNENLLLSGTGSAKEIRHISFELGESNIQYQPGDALGVMPLNAPDLVNAILAQLGAKFDQMLTDHDECLGQLLTKSLEIMTPSKELIYQVDKYANCSTLRKAIGNKDMLEKFLWGKDVLDLISLVPRNVVNANEFVTWLRPLQHRAYSISSSPKIHETEIHLTVAAVRWNYNYRVHKGVASTFLADHSDKENKTGIFLQRNKNFRIPIDNNVPMIMVGPGTGIAPFRAFLQERKAIGASGMNWLFFGDQHRKSDFLYETEFLDMKKTGFLNRLDLAFSRDQSDKVYVQNKMLESGEALYAALENGGTFYVCGDAGRMAKDVDKALHKIISIHGGISSDKSIDYVNGLKREKRYLRDVY